MVTLPYRQFGGLRRKIMAGSLDDSQKLLPFYLLCDVSASMFGVLDDVNQILPALTVALERDPIICDKIRFGVIDFSDDARLVLPLCELLDQETLPALSCRGGTNYGAAFDFLRSQLEQDVNTLKADGYLVHRPAVFFLSDGSPTDAESSWRSAFANLTQYDKQTDQGFAFYPNFIPFGLNGCDPRLLQQLIHPTQPKERSMKMFLQAENQGAAEAVTTMAKLLVNSVVKSGAGLAGAGGIVLPEKGDDLDVVIVEPDDDLYL